MGNYAAQNPCLLLAFSCGRGNQKLDLKWLSGGGRTAEPALGLCSSKLPSARGEKREALAFCAGLPALVGWCLRDSSGCGKQPAVMGAYPGLVMPAGMRLALVHGSPHCQRADFADAWVHVGFQPSVLPRCVALSTCRCPSKSLIRSAGSGNCLTYLSFFFVSSPQCHQCQTTSSPCRSQNGSRQYRPTWRCCSILLQRAVSKEKSDLCLAWINRGFTEALAGFKGLGSFGGERTPLRICDSTCSTELVTAILWEM